MKMRAIAAAAAVLSLAAAGMARADNLNFSYFGQDGSSFNFNLGSMPTPDDYESGEYTHFTVNGAENGVSGPFGITFYNSDDNGGLSTDDNAIDVDGQESGGVSIYQQIYSGTEDTPVFTTGVYQLYYGDEDFDSLKLNIIGPPQPDQTQAGTLTIREAATSAAPEPSTWALMLGGVGILGGLLRVSIARRREDQASGMAEA